MALPSKTVADPSLIPRVDAHINTPKFVSATRLVMRTPARTVKRQLPSRFAASELLIDDSSDMSPVCEFSASDAVFSGIVAGTHQETKSE